MPDKRGNSVMLDKPRFPKYLREALAKFPNIRSDRGVMSGAPCVANRRIPVWVIAGLFAAGETIAMIANDYDLTPQDVRDALRFACWTSRLGRISFWKFWEEKVDAG